uniref:phosphopyruvate hydratase n=1 Tax=Salix viminalis TaxID=40686 RepID=A0A6N2LFW0_SALVM
MSNMHLKIEIKVSMVERKNELLSCIILCSDIGAGAIGLPLYKHIQQILGTKELVIPVPAFNVLHGGSHAGNNLAIQCWR